MADGRVNNGGPREGAGRKLQPSSKALRIMRKYMDLCYKADAKLMAHLALRPKEFEDKVIFGGKETDEQSGDDTKQTRTGGYFLDPLFKEQIEMLKFRWKKLIPNPPQEIQASIDQTLHHVWTILKDSEKRSEIPLHSENGSTTHPLNNGSEKLLSTSQKVVELPAQSVTVEVKQDSSPSPVAGIWSTVKKQE